MSRAVLIVDKSKLWDAPQRLQHELDTAAAAGIDVVALVDIADARKAHGMVYHGECDLIVYSGDVLPTVHRLTLPRAAADHTGPVEPTGSTRFRRPQAVS
jgi:hypothetical protein